METPADPREAFLNPFDTLGPTSLDAMVASFRASPGARWRRRIAFFAAVAAGAYLAVLCVGEIAPASLGPRIPTSTPRSPAEAASWAAAPFTVQVPLASAEKAPLTQPRVAVPHGTQLAREASLPAERTRPAGPPSNDAPSRTETSSGLHAGGTSVDQGEEDDSD